MNTKKDILIFLVLPLVILVTICAFYFRGDRIKGLSEVNKDSVSAEKESKTDDNSSQSGEQDVLNPSMKTGTGTKNPDEVAHSSTEIVNKDGKTLRSRIRVMEGYERIEYDKGSFGEYVREYPLKKDGAKVKMWDGSAKENMQGVEAVFKLPMEKRDLQQCADSIMRMYAEYFWNNNRKDEISFQLTDGFKLDYKNWSEGGRPDFSSGATKWIQSGREDDSYESFKEYLRIVFAYAGTSSMIMETKKIKLKNIDIGDIFIEAGAGGHVCMVVDVCEKEGKKAFLLAQGFTPAQQFYVLKNPAHEEDPWYYQEEIKYPLKTPDYTFHKGSLRRLNYIADQQDEQNKQDEQDKQNNE